MNQTKLPGVVLRFVWATRVAQARRHGAVDTSRPTTVAVASIDNRMLTTPVAALIALLLEEVSMLPVAAIEADGISQPLRGPLGAGAGGDIVGLSKAPARSLTRLNIETFADARSTVPLIVSSEQHHEVVDSDILDTVLSRVQHRWPTVVMNLPYTCPPETIATGTALADRVILVADRHLGDYGWLYQPGHHLTEKARAGHVTVVTVGDAGNSLPADMVALPNIGADTTARSRLIPSTAPEDLSMYHRLLVRLYD